MTVVACIVLFLIILTIIFEVLKEHIEEHADRNMKPIIQKLFGEMTVLGFLSVVTFIITKSGFFESLSIAIFGEEDEMLEIFEFIHFTLFFVMIFFVLQVLLLVQQAMQTEKNWNKMERYVMHPESEHGGRDDNEYTMFAALRQEFLADRDFEPPFHPKGNLKEDFNFGHYLGICLGVSLTHVVEVKANTWYFFAFFTVVYYGLSLLVHENNNVSNFNNVPFI